MNVLFVYSLEGLVTPRGLLMEYSLVHLGISYIAAFLKKHGHSTSLVVLNTSFRYSRNIALVKKSIEETAPRLICFTSTASQHALMAKIAGNIKRDFPDIYLLAGGPHVSLNPHEALRDPFDAICVGEGEHPTLELVTALSKGIRPQQIQNLWFKNAGAIETNMTRPFLADLDSLPFPDYSLWQDWVLNPSVAAGVFLLLGRGCPYDCSYCCNHALKDLATGPYVRFRSPANVIKEIYELKARFPSLVELYFEVETITANTRWTLELCRALEDFNRTQAQPMAFGVNYRITPQTDQVEILAALKRSNFRYLKIGLESGSERVRREVLRRSYTNKEVLDLVALARKHGIRVDFYNLIGIPGETQADFQDTIRLNRICQPGFHYTSIFCPYPGTDLFNKCKEQGLLKKNFDFRLERQKSRLDLPGFTKRQIQNGYVWFEFNIYSGQRPWSWLLKRLLDRMIACSPFWAAVYALLYPLRKTAQFCMEKTRELRRLCCKIS